MVFYSINKLFNLIHLPSYLPIYQQTSQNWSLDTSSKELITEEACGVLYSKLSSISIRPYNPGLAENTFTSPRVEISYLDSQRQLNNCILCGCSCVKDLNSSVMFSSYERLGR